MATRRIRHRHLLWVCVLRIAYYSSLHQDYLCALLSSRKAKDGDEEVCKLMHSWCIWAANEFKWAPEEKWRRGVRIGECRYRVSSTLWWIVHVHHRAFRPWTEVPYTLSSPLGGLGFFQSFSFLDFLTRPPGKKLSFLLKNLEKKKLKRSFSTDKFRPNG